MTHHGGFAGFESYDGKTLYFSKFNGGGIWSVPVAGAEEKRITDAPHIGYWGGFAVTKDGIYLLDSEADRGPALMYYSFRSRQLKRILTLNGPQKAFHLECESRCVARWADSTLGAGVHSGIPSGHGRKPQVKTDSMWIQSGDRERRDKPATGRKEGQPEVRRLT